MSPRNRSAQRRLLVLLPVLVGLAGAFYVWRQSADDVSACQAQVRMLEEEVAALREFRVRHPGAVASVFLSVYGTDIRFDPEHMVKAFYVAVPVELPLLQKLRLLASKMSWYRFDRLPLDVLSIEDIGGKQIAVVNLSEPDGMYTQYSWSGRYFQGSTGGQITQNTLVLTFLQRGYPGKWIDGVRFCYQGKPFTDEWDHINLSGTFYRNGSRCD